MEEEEPIVVSPFLDKLRNDAMTRIISHLDGVGTQVKAQYPKLEQDTWTIQKIEAERLHGLGPDPSTEAILGAAPLLTLICSYHFGAGTPEERATQVLVKGETAMQLSSFLLNVAAFVNGLRARTQESIEVADTSDSVLTIESAFATELETFRSEHGLI